MTVLVQGVLGGVGALAAQLAHRAGATVIGTVRQRGDLERVNASAVAHAVAFDQPDPAGAIRAHPPDGVDRVLEVAFSDNIDLDAAVAKNHTVIAAYATRADRPDFPFWPMLFDNVTIRLLGSDDFPAVAKQQAAADLTAAAGDGALSIAIGRPLPLERAAQAHDRLDAGTRDRVLISIPEPVRALWASGGGMGASVGRRFGVGVLLVVALAVGLVQVSRQPAAQASASGDNVVVQWDESTLQAIRDTRPPPPAAARALAVVHTAIYDAWAAYDALAVGTRLLGGLRQPSGERTQANKEKAISFAAYGALVDLFPSQQPAFAGQMTALGYATDGSDTSPAAAVGATAAQAVLDYRHADGSNQAN